CVCTDFGESDNAGGVTSLDCGDKSVIAGRHGRGPRVRPLRRPDCERGHGERSFRSEVEIHCNLSPSDLSRKDDTELATLRLGTEAGIATRVDMCRKDIGR